MPGTFGQPVLIPGSMGTASYVLTGVAGNEVFNAAGSASSTSDDELLVALLEEAIYVLDVHAEVPETDGE